MMIDKDLAYRIWSCHREIEVSNDLVKKMTEELHGEEIPDLRDSFGRRRNLQLGIPSGENCHRLFDVDVKLALAVIRAHIANKTQELEVLSEEARSSLTIKVKSK